MAGPADRSAVAALAAAQITRLAVRSVGKEWRWLLESPAFVPLTKVVALATRDSPRVLTKLADVEALLKGYVSTQGLVLERE